MESESLPLGSASGYDLRTRTDRPAAGQAVPRPLAGEALTRIERRIAKHLQGAGIVIVHDLAVPATATEIDHLCIGPHGVTAIDVEREPGGFGRAAMLERVLRETEVLRAVLTEAEVPPERVAGAVCRAGRLEPLRTVAVGGVTVGGPRGVSKLARRSSSGRPIDVQLTVALIRNHLGHESQRSHRVTRPDALRS